ncbi:MAG: GNAT family protein [Gemmatimonadota bacterium]
MNLAAIALEGRHVRLAPMGLHHVDALWAAAQDPKTWEFSSAVIRNLEECRTYVETAVSWQSAGTAVPFVTMDRASGQVIGSTRFANIDRTHRRAEIGWTWLNPKWWRSAMNTEAKYLMLRHAFEEWKCMRVELKTGHKNVRSQDAIERIGGVREGTLRKHMVQPDGSIRDSVYFSILDDEWPTVKSRLEARLSRP